MTKKPVSNYADSFREIVKRYDNPVTLVRQQAIVDFHELVDKIKDPKELHDLIYENRLYGQNCILGLKKLGDIAMYNYVTLTNKKIKKALRINKKR